MKGALRTTLFLFLRDFVLSLTFAVPDFCLRRCRGLAIVEDWDVERETKRAAKEERVFFCRKSDNRLVGWDYLVEGRGRHKA